MPNLLFNIAKVQEKTENWDEAEKNYKEFIKSPDADPNAREVALERIDAIGEIKRAAAEANKPKPEEKPEEKPPPPPEKKASIVPWIMLGSGAAIAATGGVFGIMALGKQSEFDDATTAEEKRDLRSTGKTFALVADISYGVGLAVGVVGVIMLLTSGGDEPATQTAVLPVTWFGPHGEAGAGINVRF